MENGFMQQVSHKLINCTAPLSGKCIRFFHTIHKPWKVLKSWFRSDTLGYSTIYAYYPCDEQGVSYEDQLARIVPLITPGSQLIGIRQPNRTICEQCRKEIVTCEVTLECPEEKMPE